MYSLTEVISALVKFFSVHGEQLRQAYRDLSLKLNGNKELVYIFHETNSQ